MDQVFDSREKPSGARVEVYRDRKKRWRYRLYAANGREVGASEQSFVRRDRALTRALEAARGRDLARPNVHVPVYVDDTRRGRPLVLYGFR